MSSLHKGKIPVAITIAGSDSGGGAGIQADLKTFAAFGVHGTTAITAITAQNTHSVISIQDVDVEMVRKQIRAVAEDIGIDAGKIGMLHIEEIIRGVASELENYDFPLVIDPVMVSKSGVPLLKTEAIEAFKTHLLRRAMVVTPNKFEAEMFAKMKIRNIEDAKVAAKEISKIGVRAVVVKGGHLDQRDAVDVLYYKDEFKLFKAPKLNVKTTHGTGCSFSAAIAAGLAKGEDIPTAIENAKRFVTLAIKFGLDLGKGYGPVNSMANLYRESSRYDVLLNVEEAKTILESSSLITELVPEVGMNIAMAIPYVEDVEDVAAIPGRIVKAYGGVRSVAHPKFGCSSHLSRYILEMVKHDPSKRAAVNLKFSEKILDILRKMELKVSYYDRMKEPEEIKRTEGRSIPWGVDQAVKKLGEAPDVIYHMGDYGKEPMIVIFGKKANDLAKLTIELAKKMKV
ncbi:MAG: bifunctional hydroxymethylpyrimidine kinase/phosphomethylpyrimidine kinase [Thermoproteota archaeon]